MVCKFGGGRMAVMARLLEAGSFSQNMAEDVGRQKLAGQCVYRELREADEANFLDEEDMNVFGLKPMTDLLHLVCCNACKKPVKASQYSAHAELCRSLSSKEERILELDGGTGQRKPLRKERRKLLSAYNNQATPVGMQEQSESTDADDTSLSEFSMDGQVGTNSFSIDAKGNSRFVEMASAMIGSRISPENPDHSSCAMPPPTKRSKLVAVDRLHLSDDVEIAMGATQLRNTQDAYTSGDLPRHTIPGSEMPSNCVLYKDPGQAQDNCFTARNVPAPLAAKIYYSQRNSFLRSALSHLFQEVGSREHGNMVSSQSSEQDILQSQASCQRGTLLKQGGNLLSDKEHASAWKPAQVIAKNSEACLGTSGGCLQASNFSNKFAVDNSLRPQVASIELTRSKYLSQPYPFAGNSGKLLGTVKQPNGSVHVV